MTKRILIVSLLLIFMLCGGCAHTPGDAALRGGHPEAAANLYMKGAELGDPEAALKLGLLISEGTVTESHYDSASHWYRRACDLGSLPGCHNLGVAYEYGKNGVSKDIRNAHDYYLKAAEQGYMQSQYNPASLYSNGYIEPQNNVEGYKWMLLSQKAARKCGAVPVCEWILQDPPGHKNKLKNRMKEDQIREAEMLAASWTVKK